MMPGKKRLILQANQASIEDYLKASDPMALDTALHQVGLTADEVEIMIAGPGTTLDVIISETQKWNQLMKNGCVQGGPVSPITSRAVDVSATSTPAPASTAEPTAASTLARTLEPTIRGYGGYPVTDTTPGGITILSKGEVIVVPNPVSSLPSEWKIYKDPFYTYTVAYPPDWFLIAPPPDAIEKAYAAGAKQVLGLSISISSVDSSKGPGTEPRVLTPQDSLGIDITVDDYPIKPGESLKEWMTRPIERVWPGAITSIEEVDFKGLPALIVHHRSIAPVDENLALLNIYIAAKDGRVFRIGARPDPKDTIYSDTFKQILDSFTILEQ